MKSKLFNLGPKMETSITYPSMVAYGTTNGYILEVSREGNFGSNWQLNTPIGYHKYSWVTYFKNKFYGYFPNSNSGRLIVTSNDLIDWTNNDAAFASGNSGWVAISDNLLVAGDHTSVTTVPIVFDGRNLSVASSGYGNFSQERDRTIYASDGNFYHLGADKKLYKSSNGLTWSVAADYSSNEYIASASTMILTNYECGNLGSIATIACYIKSTGGLALIGIVDWSDPGTVNSRQQEMSDYAGINGDLWYTGGALLVSLATSGGCTVGMFYEMGAWANFAQPTTSTTLTALQWNPYLGLMFAYDGTSNFAVSNDVYNWTTYTADWDTWGVAYTPPYGI